MRLSGKTSFRVVSDTHPVTLTETGEWFQTVAQEIMRRIARVPKEARAVAVRGFTTLRLASTDALSFAFLPRGFAVLNHA
jgi:DNA-binding transcriptional LysR family regulator